MVYRVQSFIVMASSMSGLVGGYSWGRDRYRLNTKFNDVVAHSVLGFLFYSFTWPATVPMTISQNFNK